MQHIPDKDFDRLFNDKFADAEMEPSKDLWSSIEQQMTSKKKRTFPIYWMAAASVAILIAALLVFDKKDVIKLKGQDQIASVAIPSKVEESVSAGPTLVAVTQGSSTPNGDANVSTKMITNTARYIDDNPIDLNSKNSQLALQPIIEGGRLPIKQQDVKPLAIVPISETAIENQIMTASVEVEQNISDNTISESGAERKGIRNVGDLVNFVVDKVDKRDKKLLRFNTDDDDNSSLIGINIGFLKLNSKKHK